MVRIGKNGEAILSEEEKLELERESLRHIFEYYHRHLGGLLTRGEINHNGNSPNFKNALDAVKKYGIIDTRAGGQKGTTHYLNDKYYEIMGEE